MAWEKIIINFYYFFNTNITIYKKIKDTLDISADNKIY